MTEHKEKLGPLMEPRRSKCLWQVSNRLTILQIQKEIQIIFHSLYLSSTKVPTNRWEELNLVPSVIVSPFDNLYYLSCSLSPLQDGAHICVRRAGSRDLRGKRKCWTCTHIPSFPLPIPLAFVLSVTRHPVGIWWQRQTIHWLNVLKTFFSLRMLGPWPQIHGIDKLYNCPPKFQNHLPCSYREQSLQMHHKSYI